MVDTRAANWKKIVRHADGSNSSLSGVQIFTIERSSETRVFKKIKNIPPSRGERIEGWSWVPWAAHNNKKQIRRTVQFRTERLSRYWHFSHSSLSENSTCVAGRGEVFPVKCEWCNRMWSNDQTTVRIRFLFDATGWFLRELIQITRLVSGGAMSRPGPISKNSRPSPYGPHKSSTTAQRDSM